MKLSNIALIATLASLSRPASGAGVDPAKLDTYMELMHPEGRRLRKLQAGCPMVYDGTVDTANTFGEITCEPSIDLPCYWDFWKIDLIEGVPYTIKVERIDCGMDPAMTLYKGTDAGYVMPYQTFSSCSDLGSQKLEFEDCADDDRAPPGQCPAEDYGFFGAPLFAYEDPVIYFTPDETTWYTIAVQNFIPNTKPGGLGVCPGDDNHDYKIIIDPPRFPTTYRGGAYEDPHIKLWNGTWFDYHGECDLVLVDAPNFGGEEDLPLTIQIRTTMRYFYSYIEAAVLKIGDELLEVESWGEYTLNGVEGALEETGSVPTIGGFPIKYERINEKQVKFEVIISPTEKVTLSTFKDMVSVSVDADGSHRFDGSVGIMGSTDGTMLARDGSTVLNDPYEFGPEWQVTADEPMLFRTTRSPQAPAKCLHADKASAEAQRRRLGENGVSRTEAEAACSQVPMDHKEACIMDVMAVGDIDIATAGAY